MPPSLEAERDDHEGIPTAAEIRALAISIPGATEMTKRERAVKDRPWLKMRVFCITASLKRKMEADKTLTEKQKEWLAYIQNKVIIESREKPAFYVNIGSKYFQDRIGSNYRRWINYLIRKGELDENRSYWAGGGDDAHPMSYRLTRTALGSGIVKVTYQRKKAQPPKSKPRQPSGDVVIEFVEKNLRKLTVAKTLVWGNDDIAHSRTHEFCVQIFHQRFDVHRGPQCRRLLHPVISMPKVGRANLQLADSTEQLFEYDVKSCHPVLMLNLFTDSAERRSYSQLLEADVYDGAAAVMQKALTRDEVKQDFMEAINRSERDLGVLEKKWVYQFFRQKFPIFTEQVLNVRTDLALFFQNEEAKLMVDELGRFCQANDYFWIPCHDGWMGTAQHEQKIVGKVHELFHAYCGFWVAVSKLELVGRSTLSLFTYPLSGSYVQGNDTSPTPPALEKVSGEVGGLEKAAVPAQPSRVSITNPWVESVERWRQQNDPIQLQEGANKRAEARKRQKEGERMTKANKRASNQLARQVAEAMKRMGE